jgi:hypothetical protein
MISALASGTDFGYRSSSIAMAEQQPDLNYPILVTEKDGAFELRIRELLLVVRGADLQQAYDELMRRKHEVVDGARAVGALDELPPPERPPLVDATALRARGLRALMRALSKRYL